MKRAKRQGNREGRPRSRPGESLLFTEMYTLPKKRERSGTMVSPTVSTPHIHLQGFRRVSHNRAINALRNAGYYPHAVSAKNCPSGEPYNNYVKVGYKYWVEYCLAEGLSRTSKRARRVLLYVFYAQPIFRGKQSTVMRIIHTSMTNGTHRFGNADAPRCFKKLFNILDQNERARVWLTDRGTSEDVSVAYLAAVSACVWSYAILLMAIRYFAHGHALFCSWPYAILLMAMRYFAHGHALF